MGAFGLRWIVRISVDAECLYGSRFWTLSDNGDPDYNTLAQILTGNCLTGIIIAWWKWTHNSHHIACNSLDYDPDLQHIPNLSDIPLAVLVSKGPQQACKHIGDIGFLDLVSPASFVLAYLDRKDPVCLSSFTVTSIQHIQFCFNHFSADVYMGSPNGNDWFEKQTGGTLTFLALPGWIWFRRITIPTRTSFVPPIVPVSAEENLSSSEGYLQETQSTLQKFVFLIQIHVILEFHILLLPL